ncbi:D-serine dehydratase-like isoform X2 [Styela clava]|uniref:D-threo-3-hydroxyaspartate dehydratase-like isoform X2 n=2 Tax=Styela clava TaxID=7725 RepID=UPI001939FD6C|nr:D-threo-3-hydroxyaspartate dehydratase-like isoform X2 [Styela clava]
MDISDLPTPALIVYIDKVKKNIKDMEKRSKKYGVRLRPHFKTSKVVKVAELQTAGSKRGLVVSTLPEAEALAENGFDDILYAVPLINDPDKIKRCKALSEKLSEFHVMIDTIDTANLLVSTNLLNGKKWSIFLLTDCGYHRAGALHDSSKLIELAKLLHKSEKIQFQGLYTHCGHSYHLNADKTVKNVADEVVTNLLATVERLKTLGIQCKHYGLGSTPTCSQPTEMMRKVTEWHPGNYVFYDVQQEMLDSCERSDIACMVATRIIGHYSSKGFSHMVVDCGFTALTQQGYGKVPSGGYGAILNHSELKLENLTQEVGKITNVDGTSIDFAKYPIGSMLFILPYHSCATCAMHPVYYVADNEGKIVDKWFPVRGWYSGSSRQWSWQWRRKFWIHFNRMKRLVSPF